MSYENRKFPRVTCKCSITLWEKNGFNTILTNTVNIGAGGILVNIDHGLMVGAKVDIRMEFVDNILFECSGRILRCRQFVNTPNDLKANFSVGITFKDLNEDQKKFIKELVEKISIQQNGL